MNTRGQARADHIDRRDTPHVGDRPEQGLTRTTSQATVRAQARRREQGRGDDGQRNQDERAETYAAVVARAGE